MIVVMEATMTKEIMQRALTRDISKLMERKPETERNESRTRIVSAGYPDPFHNTGFHRRARTTVFRF